MDVKDFDYELPEELIAQDPLADRSSSRLMVVDKKTGEVEHRIFRDITEYLRAGDCLVLNNTKVIPARLFGVKEGTQAKIELLLLKRRENDVWETLVKPGKKAKPGTKIIFGEGLLCGEVIDVVEEGNRLIQFHYEGIFEEILDRLGQMPLPPYITHQLKDKNRYQTVYAKYDGSAAAPTAGLHFSPELLKEIERMGVVIAEVTLHVGLGTFRPVKVENVLDHHMHSEFYRIEQQEADKINAAKLSGSRVIAVGTTSTRTLEAVSDEAGRVTAKSGWTDIFIYPGYRFKVIDGLITNFHLPQSTLLMLVSALAGKEHMLRAYRLAVKEKYRFFSFGDAMLITDRNEKRGVEMEEKRKHKRLELDVSIELECLGEDGAAELRYVPVDVTDISRAGIGFKAEHKLSEGSFFDTKLQIWTKEILEVVIKIVRVEETEDTYRYGGIFIGMADSDVFKIDVYQIFNDVEG